MTSGDAVRLAARLAHDVGKYVARTAHNVLPGAERSAAPPLIDMLARDLYELADGRRASAIFAERVEPLAALVADPRLAEAGSLLTEADALEQAVRARSPLAVERAFAIAREVERLLRSVAADLGSEEG